MEKWEEYMGRGRRYDDEPKLNIKKVVATIVAIIVVIMFIVSIRKLLSGWSGNKEVNVAQAFFPAYVNEKWGVINQNGDLIIDAIYDEMVVVPDTNKDIFICTYDVNYENETYQTKVINQKGTEIFTNYHNVQPIENSDNSNIWYENNVLKFEQDGKYGLIDFSGKLILNPEYDNIYSLAGVEKNIIIEQNGLKGLVNTSMGEVIVRPEYTEIATLTDSYENGYIVQKNGKYGVIGADSKVVFEPVYDEIKKVAASGYYVVSQNGKIALVNSSGETKLDTGFMTIEEINGENMIITLNGAYGVKNVDGTSIINTEYQDLKYIYGTYYIAKKNNLYGVIATTGETVVDFTYQTMEYIKSADLIEADKENYKTDLMNRDFQVVLKDVVVSELNLENGYLRVREGEDYNYYNFKFEKKSNKEILPTNTLFLVKEFGKYGYENKNGERIVDCIYDDAKEQNKYGYCAIKKDGVWGVLKADGTVLMEPSVNLEEYLYVDFIGNWYLNKDINLNVYTK